MFFPDQSPYSYHQPKPLNGVFNIGWLDRGHPYATGVSPPEFVAKLAKVLSARSPACFHVNRIRGVHPCNLCRAEELDELDPRGTMFIGSSELWVPRTCDGFLVAPSMVLHYVVEHRYLPPPEFMATILALDLTRSYDAQADYQKLASLAMG
jgi:hypothetical protein